MKLPDFVTGRMVAVNLQPYRMDWDRVVSKPQKAVKDFLRPYWQAHAMYEEVALPGKGRMRIDLLNTTRGVVIEVSPRSSHSFNKFFHKNDRFTFGAAVGRDLKKAEWVKAAGFTLVEISDDDMDKLSAAWFLATFNVSL